MTDQTSSSTTTKTEKKVEKKEGEGFSPLLIAGIVAGIVIIAVLVVWLGADSKSTLSARQALPGVSTTVQPSTTSSPHSVEVRVQLLEKRLTALEQADIPLLRQDVARLQQSPKVTTTSEGVFLESGIKGSEDKLLKTTSGKDSSLAACNCCCEQPKPRVVHKPRKKPVIATRTVAASPVASHATASATGAATATATATAGAPPQVVASAPSASLPPVHSTRKHWEICTLSINGQVVDTFKAKTEAECDAWQDGEIRKRFTKIADIRTSPPPPPSSGNRKMEREICQIRVRGEIIAETLRDTKAECEAWRDQEAEKRGLRPVRPR